MSLQNRLTDLTTRIATEIKTLRTLINGNTVDLSALTTTAKGNLVAALNELKSDVDAAASSGGASINDVGTSTASVWSSGRTNDAITTAIAVLTTGAPAALDTLDELAAALGDDANFAATITTALGNRVRTDTATQGLTTQQQQNARTNISVLSATEIGDPETNFVTTFNAGLV